MENESWRKLYIQAIKKLPEEFVDEGTRITTFDDNIVYAANPKFVPIVFNRSENEWKELKFVHTDNR